MSIGRARTVALLGIDAVDVIVEAHVATGLPGFSVIGSSGAAAGEAAERVRTALITVEAGLARSKVLVSLAPADLPKVGARYDLAMAVAVLCQRGIVPPAAMRDTAFVGELALDGSVRPVSGVLPSAYHLLRAGVRRLVVASANAAEARTATGLEIVGVRSLSDAVAALTGQPVSGEGSGAGENGWPGEDAARLGFVPAASSKSGASAWGASADLADVRGQHMARRALEIAAAGAHHMLLLGPPGCGKSMLAARLPGLLPPLSDEEAFQLAAIRSVLGRLDSTEVLDRRAPLSAPHHTISASGLLGGGSGVARPGQLSLASGGVLFLDELFEWPRHVLDALREPLEEGVVRVARSKATVVFPARVQLICAANPCPCGGRTGGSDGGCQCAPETVWRYRAKLSGPLADRLDLAPAVEPLRARDLDGPPGEASAAVAERVAAARAASIDRCGLPAARAPTRVLRAQLDRGAAAALARAVDRQDLTGRGHDRCLAVARTVADLAGKQTIGPDDVDEAMAHRLALRRVRTDVVAQRAGIGA